MTKAITASVTGRVQGVGFRYTTREIGRRLGLAGWVRNRPDGSVEVWAQGDEEALAEFAQFLKEGPPAARVHRVSISDVDPDPTHSRFEVTF